MNNSFYTKEELSTIGFKEIGENVLISRKCSIYSPQKIKVGSNVRIDDYCILTGHITLGSYIHIAAYSALYGGTEGIYMEDFSGLSSKCIIYAMSDDYSGKYMTNPMVQNKYTNIISKKVVISKHSIIGSGTTILPGVTIGEGNAIGAMSLVRKSTKPWKVYFGIPIKEIGNRSRDLLELEKQYFDFL